MNKQCIQLIPQLYCMTLVIFSPKSCSLHLKYWNIKITLSPISWPNTPFFTTLCILIETSKPSSKKTSSALFGGDDDEEEKDGLFASKSEPVQAPAKKKVKQYRIVHWWWKIKT